MDDVPMRRVSVWRPQLRQTVRDDGSILIWRDDPLADHAPHLSDRIRHWAQVRPRHTWMAERGADGAWVGVDYATLADLLPRVGTALLDLGLSVDRPLLILSGNGVAHAIAALSAQDVGIPSAAVSTAYALASTDFAKLRSIAAQITPGAVFVDAAEAHAAAIAAVFGPDVPVIAVRGSLPDRAVLRWDDVLATAPDPRAQAARAALGPDAVAKFMFTSGTTGSPKAVIQTQRMLCANQAMIADCYAFLAEAPPVFVDWAPWSHVAAGSKVFNMTLWHGGTFHVDAGKPSPEGMAETIRNLREVSPTWYFNVPAGYERLVAAMEADAGLRDAVFRDLAMLMYAGAGMAADTWARLQALSVAATGHRVLLATGLGSTETAPFALFCTDPQDRPGNVGIPAQGVTMKLVPVDGRLDLRLKGPSVTPGYWRDPMRTAEAFDDEGFYMMGDALRYAVPGDAAAGFVFDGRTAENFKLRTGTWVAVGAVRAALIDAMGGLVRDAVIAGEGRASLGALLIPQRRAAEALVPGGAALSDAALFAHPLVRARLAALLADHAGRATGSAARVDRALVLGAVLSFDAGEVTDKGSVNQRAVLRHRAALVERLYSDDAGVIRAAPAPAGV